MTADERALLLALAKGVVKILEDEADVWETTDPIAVEIWRLVERVAAASPLSPGGAEEAQ